MQRHIGAIFLSANEIVWLVAWIRLPCFPHTQKFVERKWNACDFLIMFWWLKGQFNIVCKFHLKTFQIVSRQVDLSVKTYQSTTINFIHVLQIAVGETRWPHQATSQTNEERNGTKLDVWEAVVHLNLLFNLIVQLRLLFSSLFYHLLKNIHIFRYNLQFLVLQIWSKWL